MGTDSHSNATQIYIAPMSIANGLVTGMMAGLVAKKIKNVKPDEMYRDNVFYRVPEDFHTSTTSQNKKDDDDDVFV